MKGNGAYMVALLAYLLILLSYMAKAPSLVRIQPTFIIGTLLLACGYALLSTDAWRHLQASKIGTNKVQQKQHTFVASAYLVLAVFFAMSFLTPGFITPNTQPYDVLALFGAIAMFWSVASANELSGSIGLLLFGGYYALSVWHYAAHLGHNGTLLPDWGQITGRTLAATACAAKLAASPEGSNHPPSQDRSE